MLLSELRREGADSRPAKRLLVPIFGIAIAFSTICAWVLYESRVAAWERAAESAESLVRAIEADVARNIATINLSLDAVIENIGRPDIADLSPEIRNLILFDRSTTAHHLGKILVTDENGDVQLDSRSLHPEPMNIADREYFQVHKINPNAGTYIGRPIVSRFNGQSILGISRRISHADGSFAGVAIASLRLSYFEEIFKTVSLGDDGNVTLSSDDGFLLVRWPWKSEYAGMNMSNAKLYEHLTRARAGRFESYSKTDGMYRLVVYSRIGNLPLVIGVGQSTAEIYAQWHQFATTVAVMIAILCAITIALALYFVRELARRKAVELQLATLATKDGLTKLANRRHFDTIFDREWGRAIRDQSSLSMLMIDTDRFKDYNDTHGHQAGDLLLQIIGGAIMTAMSRGTDLAARYGGDEFVVLLPGTAVEGARKVADKVLQFFADECRAQGISDGSISLGIGSAKPLVGSEKSDLFAAADRALYRAKSGGRSRIEAEQILNETPVSRAA